MNRLQQAYILINRAVGESHSILSLAREKSEDQDVSMAISVTMEQVEK